MAGGRFDFDDGGTYCGGWEDGKAHGHGVCTGPKGQGEYSGSWHFGFEVCGVYAWPSGSTYEGQWQNGKRHGLGVETRGRWTYRGEWTQGFKGRYGVRQSASSGAKYEGTWANGLQDGYGSETYADGGTYQGQWMRGMRHGYGVRTSATFGLASHRRPSASRGGSLSSLTPEDPADRRLEDFRGGFVLKSRSDEPPARRRSLVEKSTHLKKSILQGFKIKKQRSTGDIDRRGASSVRSSGSNLSSASSDSGAAPPSLPPGGSGDSNASFVSQDEPCDAAVTETYSGEWKNDRRCGFGVAERSDGLRYEGEWYDNKKYGYGVTTLRDGTREEGKYKNNVLVSSGKKRHLFVLRSAKFRERVEAASGASLRGSQIALQKADIAISRTATSRGKAEQADIAAVHAQEDSNVARHIAKQFDPDVKIPGPEAMKPKFGDRLNPTRTPFTNLSNQSLAPQDMLRTDTPLASSRQNLSTRAMSVGTPQPQHRYISTPVPTIVQQPQQVGRTDPYATPNDPKKYMANQIPVSQPQYPSQGTVTLNQPSYANAQPVVTVMQHQQEARYPSQQDSRYQGGGDHRYQGGGPQQELRYQGGSQPAMQMQNQMTFQSSQQQARYGAQSQGGYGGGYPPQGQTQQQQQQSPQYHPKLNANYLGPSEASDPPVVPNRQGSFRRRPSAREGGYTMQQAMGDHFDHYRQEPRPRTVIKHGRRIPSPPRGGSREMTPLYGSNTPQYRSGYGPDATPDSGVSESMDGDELSPARFGRKSQLPPLIYGDSHASSLLSFAPSEDSRTMSPTMSSMGVDSEVGSEASVGSGAFARTASLYVNPPSRKKAVAAVGAVPECAHRRKKSMPHGPKEVGAQPKVIPREEVAYLSSQRREEVRRMQYEAERLRSNPLLYLVRPDLKDWFSRQQLIMLVLFINVSLAVMFFKLLS